MQNFRRILVGVQLPETGDELPAPTQAAIDRAMWLGEQLSAELMFVSVFDVTAPSHNMVEHESSDQTLTISDDAQGTLLRLVRKAEERGITADSLLTFGKGWKELTRLAISSDYDLVIVGTRDPSRASRILFGSTAMKLVRYCPKPVWVTKPGTKWDDLEFLVATDNSEVCLTALDLAVRGAQMCDAKVRVVHALEQPMASHLRRTGMSEEKIREYHQQIRDAAEKELQDQLAQTDFRTLTYGVQIDMEEGSAENIILDVLEEHDIDLIVMGTVGRSGLSGVLIGNTAERLLPQITCSLLAVKPKSFECPVSLD